MGFKANIALAMLVLRVLSLLLLVGSAVLLCTDSYKTSDGDKTTFKDIFAFRFVIATIAIGAAYQLLQLPFAAYYAATEKRLVSGKALPEFDFYADKLIALLLAAGVGAGFAISYELKMIIPETFSTLINFAEFTTEPTITELIPLMEEVRSKSSNFFVRGYIASGVLLGGCVLMIIVSILSSINRTK